MKFLRIIFLPLDALAEVKDSLDKDLKFYCIGEDPQHADSQNLETLLHQSATTPPPEPKDRDFYGMQNCFFTWFAFL